MQSLFDVRGKTVLVTGGSSGIGAMIARGFVANGAKVYITARKAEALEQTAMALSELGTCVALTADVSSVAGCTALASQLGEREPRLDVLVNNAGSYWAAPIDQFPEKGWDRTMDVNVKGVFFLTQALLPHLRAAATIDAPARVINVASINGFMPSALELYAYSASKAACIMLTRQMARRLAGDGILVNAIAPGAFPSKMSAGRLVEEGDALARANPLGRIGEPEDVAGVAIFLAARAGAYLTGAVIPCDGGAGEVVAV